VRVYIGTRAGYVAIMIMVLLAVIEDIEYV
jgi:hypothetical protein